MHLVWCSKKHIETLFLSTLNICFGCEIRIFFIYPYFYQQEASLKVSLDFFVNMLIPYMTLQVVLSSKTTMTIIANKIFLFGMGCEMPAKFVVVLKIFPA